MARKPKPERPLRPFDWVVAVTDLPDVPEGSRGRIMVADGLTWLRYWVKWDNGQWFGSIGADKLVRADRWEDYKHKRAEEAARPKEVAAETGAAGGGAGSEGSSGAPSTEGAPASGAAARIPAHLLERAKAARARASAGS